MCSLNTHSKHVKNLFRQFYSLQISTCSFSPYKKFLFKRLQNIFLIFSYNCSNFNPTSRYLQYALVPTVCYVLTLKDTISYYSNIQYLLNRQLTPNSTPPPKQFNFIFSVQTFLPLIEIYRRGYFVYHH